MRILRNIVAGVLAIGGVLMAGEAAQARPMQPPALIEAPVNGAQAGPSAASCHWRPVYHRRHWNHRHWRRYGYRGYHRYPRYHRWHRGWYGHPGWHHRWHRHPGWHRYY